MRSMVICGNNGVKTHHICPCCSMQWVAGDVAGNKTIPHYYSAQHAKDEGWKHTSNPHFCPPDMKSAWICPTCSAGYNWERKV